MYGASNAEGVTQHQSVVLYHMNGPVWYEMIKVSLPIEKYYGAHLRLEYRHCSSKLLPTLSYDMYFPKLFMVLFDS